MEELLNKEIGIRKFSEGAFGNKVKTYFSLEELHADPHAPAAIGIRYRGSGGGKCQYDIPLEDIDTAWQQWIDEGYSEDRMFMNDSSNYDSHLLIQGEICTSHRGVELRYSTIKKKMRLALAEKEEYTYGLKAKTLLRHFLDPSSYDTLFELLDVYEDHVIEFSTWDRGFGDIPSRNTIIWEVRKY